MELINRETLLVKLQSLKEFALAMDGSDVAQDVGMAIDAVEGMRPLNGEEEK